MGGVAALCLLFAAGCLARKRRLPRMAAVLAIGLLGGLLAGAVGCGGGGVTSSGLVPGTYQVTVTGTDQTNSLIEPVSTTFNVIVN